MDSLHYRLGLFSTTGQVEYLVKDPLYHHANFTNISKPFIELPEWNNCSDQANSYRDYLKRFSLPYIDTLNITGKSTHFEVITNMHLIEVVTTSL